MMSFSILFAHRGKYYYTSTERNYYIGFYYQVFFCFIGFFQNYKKTNVFMNFITIKPEYEALFLVAALI